MTIITSIQTIYLGGELPGAGDEQQYWLNLTTDSPEETTAITNAELADFLNSVFGVENHCLGIKSPDAYDPQDVNDTTEDRFKTALSGDKCFENAAILNIAEKCSSGRRQGDAIKQDVYVHWSHRDIFRDGRQYYLKATSDISPDGPRRGSTIVRLIIDFSDTDYVPVYRYADPAKVTNLWRNSPPYFLGNVLVDKKITDPRSIGIGWSMGRVVLSKALSGRLVLFLPIEYDIWTVSIPGVISGDKRVYTSTVYAYSGYLDAPAEIVVADETEDVTNGSDCDLCYGQEFEAIDPPFITGAEIEPPPEDEPEEPDEDEGYGCQSGPYSSEEYEDDCCGDSTICKVDCKEILSKNSGNPAVDEERWKQLYGDNTQIVIVPAPEGGCGDRTDKFKTSKNCDECKDIPPLIWAPGNPTDISPGGLVEIEVFDGLYQLPDKLISWSIEGDPGFEFEAGGRTLVSDRVVSVTASLSVCGPCTIRAQDTCLNQVSGDLTPTNGIALSKTEYVMAPGTGTRLDILVGTRHPPYNWQEEGYADIYSGGGSNDTYALVRGLIGYCDDATITVTDACGGTAKCKFVNPYSPCELETTSLNLSWGQGPRIDLLPLTGQPPFQWSASGNVRIYGAGTSTARYALITLIAENGGGGEITVTDNCGGSSTCTITEV